MDYSYPINGLLSCRASRQLMMRNLELEMLAPMVSLPWRIDAVVRLGNVCMQRGHRFEDGLTDDSGREC